jgi:hypothetical protein
VINHQDTKVTKNGFLGPRMTAGAVPEVVAVAAADGTGFACGGRRDKEGSTWCLSALVVGGSGLSQ